MTNAVLTVKFTNNTYTFPVTWKQKCFAEGEDIAERLFFSDEFAESEYEDYADMNVSLVSNPAIKSRVVFEAEVGEIFSTRSLDKLLAKDNA
jgi:hypothetical protein